MNRHEKELVMHSLRNDLASNEATFLIKVEGLTVTQLQNLRIKLRQQGSSVKVAKNTFVKIVTRDIPGMSELRPYLKQELALVMSKQNTSQVAKTLFDMAAEYDHLKVVAGFFESKVILPEMVQYLATLPPRPILLAHVVGALKTPLVRPVSVMHQVLARFLMTLNKIAEKKD